MSGNMHHVSLPSDTWSEFPHTLVNMEKLNLLCHSNQLLQKNSYVTSPLSHAVIGLKVRCKNCNLPKKKAPHKFAVASVASTDQDLITFDDVRDQQSTTGEHHATEVAKAARMMGQVGPQKHACMFHTGVPRRGFFDCCGGRTSTKGCESNLYHEAADDAGLVENWTYYKTPTTSLTTKPHYQPRMGTSAARKNRSRSQISRPFVDIAVSNNIRFAVALDCEMGITVQGDSELIRLTMVDLFSQEVLIDSLIYPSLPMLHWNSRYSGVTAQAMHTARRNRTCILGRTAARRKIWEFVGPDTVVVMHGGQNDFTALRWIHDRVVDTFLLEYLDRHALKGKSLKELCARKFNVEIQKKRQNGQPIGHDSLEDALACRELAIWWAKLIPDE